MKIILLLLLIIILNYLYVREYFTDNLDSKIVLNKENEEEMDLAQWFERATELKIDIFDDD